MSWLNETIEKELKAIEDSKEYPGWFSHDVISRIPYVAFPGRTEAENLFIHDQAQNVMRQSLLNQFKEISSVFRIDEQEKKNVLITKGDYKKVLIFNDNRVKNIIENANKNKNLLIVNIHNHTGNGIFSINDLYVFTENISIKIMEIINTNGEISFLMRPDFMELQGIVSIFLNNIVPDFNSRIISWKIQNPEKEYELSNILNEYESKKIVKETLKMITAMGIDYCPYGNQERINQFGFAETFDQKQQILANTNLQKLDQKLSDDFIEDTNPERGEDGYE